MPRSARLDAPGALHHIIIRGIERRKIFRDNADREDFLDRLATLLPATGAACFAWALMPNHAHFLFCTGHIPIATLMRRLLTGYALSFNRRHSRSGQLFQNRYKSILCQEDAYLAELVRYIHLNPLRARLVKNLEELSLYCYCGHGVLMGTRKLDWQDSDYVLSFFDTKVSGSRKKYHAFLAEGLTGGRRDELTGGGLIRILGGWREAGRESHVGGHRMSDERILGDSDFVAAMLARAEEQFERSYMLKRSGYDMEKVAERAAALCGVDVEKIFSPGRQRTIVQARSLFCYWAARELGLSHTELARRLGISVSAVGYAVQRGEALAQEKRCRLME